MVPWIIALAARSHPRNHEVRDLRAISSRRLHDGGGAAARRTAARSAAGTGPPSAAALEGSQGILGAGINGSPTMFLKDFQRICRTSVSDTPKSMKWSSNVLTGCLRSARETAASDVHAHACTGVSAGARTNTQTRKHTPHKRRHANTQIQTTNTNTQTHRHKSTQACTHAHTRAPADADERPHRVDEIGAQPLPVRPLEEGALVEAARPRVRAAEGVGDHLIVPYNHIGGGGGGGGGHTLI